MSSVCRAVPAQYGGYAFSVRCKVVRVIPEKTRGFWIFRHRIAPPIIMIRINDDAYREFLKEIEPFGLFLPQALELKWRHKEPLPVQGQLRHLQLEGKSAYSRPGGAIQKSLRP